jgi:hypothetical protein
MKNEWMGGKVRMSGKIFECTTSGQVQEISYVDGCNNNNKNNNNNNVYSHRDASMVSPRADVMCEGALRPLVSARVVGFDDVGRTSAGPAAHDEKQLVGNPTSGNATVRQTMIRNDITN